MATSDVVPQSPQPAASTTLSGAWPLLKESIGVYRARFWLFLGLSLWIVALIFVPLLLFFVLSALFGVSEDLLGGLFVLLVLAAVFLSPWGQIASILLVQKSGEASRFRDLLKRSFPLILPVIWVMILSFLLIMGGLFLLIIPGIILALSFVFGMQAITLDGDRGVAALQRSRFLVAGRWGKVFWRFLFLGICLFIISIPGFFFEPGSSNAWIGDLYSSAVGLFAGPIFVIYPTLLYLELKKTRPETFTPDLAQRKKYLVLGVLGILGTALLVIGLAWAAASFYDEVGDTMPSSVEDFYDY